MKSSGYQRYGIVLLLGGLALFGITVHLNFTQPEFLAVARIRVQRLDPRTPYHSSLQGENGLVVSDVMLSNVIENLGLQQKWGECYAGGKTLELSEATLRLRQHLELSPVRNSVLGTPTALTEIRVTDNEPREAAQIANAIAESIQREHLARNQEASTTLETTWEKQWKDRQQKIREVQNKLNALRIDLHISEHENPESDSDPEKLRSFNELNAMLTRLEAELRDFKIDIKTPEMLDKIAMALVEIADSAQPPRQPVWPSAFLKTFLFISAASLTLAGMTLITIPRG